MRRGVVAKAIAPPAPGAKGGVPGGAPGAAGTATPASRGAESVVPLLSYDPMELEIGFGLIPLVDVNQGGDLLERITLIRRHAARDLGIAVPPIRVRDNLQLASEQLLREDLRSRSRAGGGDGQPSARDEPRHRDQRRSTAFRRRAGVRTARTVDQRKRAAPTRRWPGYTVIDPTSVIATHLTELIKAHSPDLLGRQETSALLDNIKSHYPVVVEELVPGLLTVGEVQRVLQNLLRERIPIRNLVMILENLADAARVSKDIDYLTERVRAAMARHISAEYAENGMLSVITVDPRLETLLGEAVRRGEDAYALLDPNTVAKNLRVAHAADRRCAKRRSAADRALFAVRASRAQAADRARRAATRRSFVLGDRARPQGRIDRPDQRSRRDGREEVGDDQVDLWR